MYASPVPKKNCRFLGFFALHRSEKQAILFSV